MSEKKFQQLMQVLMVGFTTIVGILLAIFFSIISCSPPVEPNEINNELTIARDCTECHENNINNEFDKE